MFSLWNQGGETTESMFEIKSVLQNLVRLNNNSISSLTLITSLNVLLKYIPVHWFEPLGGIIVSALVCLVVFGV